mmetsp:Transcript_10658/g.17650  ORF Transcript_10658/g.17650 Transcript_10658/m.17650 type:complete len:201 (+) Transcript_10658:305-907(+)
MHKLSNTTGVTTLGEHNHGTEFELVDVGHLSGSDIDLDSVVDLDIRVWVSQSASIVSDGNRNLVGRDVNLVDAAELVGGLITLDSVKDETSLGVEKKTETVSGLLELNHVHETRWEVVVGSDLSVDLDTTFHANLHALLVGEGILEAVTEDNRDREALTQLVRSSGRSRGPDSTHFAEVPMLRSMETLQMFLWSASPVVQ